MTAAPLAAAALGTAGRSTALAVDVRRANVTLVLAGRPRAASIAASDCGSTADGARGEGSGGAAATGDTARRRSSGTM